MTVWAWKENGTGALAIGDAVFAWSAKRADAKAREEFRYALYLARLVAATLEEARASYRLGRADYEDADRQIGLVVEALDRANERVRKAAAAALDFFEPKPEIAPEILPMFALEVAAKLE